MCQFGVVELDKAIQFARLRRAREAQAKRIGNTLFEIAIGSGDHSARQSLSGFEESGGVQGVQRLQRRVTAGAFEPAVLATGSVESRHHRMRARATPEGVKTPAIFVLPGAGRPLVAAVNDLPETLRLRRHDAGPANFMAEQSADR